MRCVAGVKGVKSEVYIRTHVVDCLCFFVVCSQSQQSQVLEAIQDSKQPSLSDVKVGCWHGRMSLLKKELQESLMCSRMYVSCIRMYVRMCRCSMTQYTDT